MTALEFSRWEKLRKRLLLITGKSGVKSDLAQNLGVSRSALSQWLSGGTTPTAETTLRLLEWVTEEEAKQKNPERVSARPGRQTRKGNSSNEKANPSHRPQ